MSEDSDGNEWDLLLPPDDSQLDSAPESLAGDDDDPSAPLHHTRAKPHMCRQGELQEACDPASTLTLHDGPMWSASAAVLSWPMPVVWPAVLM